MSIFQFTRKEAVGGTSIAGHHGNFLLVFAQTTSPYEDFHSSDSKSFSDRVPFSLIYVYVLKML
jgi:hypothetical protein